jgi:predicted transposase YdaD
LREGWEKGREEGRKEGIQQGKYAAALEMIIMNLSVSVTKLSKEELNEIANKLMIERCLVPLEV